MKDCILSDIRNNKDEKAHRFSLSGDIWKEKEREREREGEKEIV